MDGLPTEILLEIMIKTEHDALLELIKTNKRMKEVYEENKNYIYKQKLHRQYPCIETPEDLYYQLHHSWEEYNKLCDMKRIYTKPECDDIMLYIARVIKYLLQKSNQLMERYGRKRGMEKKIDIFIELFTNINRCYEQLDTKQTTIKRTLMEKLKEFDEDIGKLGIKSDAWTRFYETTGKEIIGKITRDI
jgi:hypothetical protein